MEDWQQASTSDGAHTAAIDINLSQQQRSPQRGTSRSFCCPACGSWDLHHAPRALSRHQLLMRTKLSFAVRTALAAFLATGLALIYPWSESLTWFGVTLAIQGVRGSLGETLLTYWDSWYGTSILSVPLIMLLSLLRSSKALTCVGLFVATVLLVSSGLTDPAKRMAGVFLTVIVLVCAADARARHHTLLQELFLCVAFGNLFSLIGILVPVPLLAVDSFRANLDRVSSLYRKLLQISLQAFVAPDEAHLGTLSRLLDDLSSVTAGLEKQLPYLKAELMLLRCDFEGTTHTRLEAVLRTLREHTDLLDGLRISLKKLQMNNTHHEFLLFLSKPLRDLFTACANIVDAVIADLKGQLSLWCGQDTEQDIELQQLTEVYELLMQEYMKARFHVVYSVTVVTDEDGAPLLRDEADKSHNATVSTDLAVLLRERKMSGQLKQTTFIQEMQRQGYAQVLLPRNAFLLNLVHLYRSMPTLVSCTRVTTPTPRKVSWRKRLISWLSSILRPPGASKASSWKAVLASLRQPAKVGVAVLLAAIPVLDQTVSNRVGKAQIWAVIAVCQTLSPYTSSSFTSGVNRVQGTGVGGVFGFALYQWFGIRSGVGLLVSLTLYVFLCSWSRTGAMYGEAAIIAAITAPVITIGPIVGAEGAIVRLSQTLLGVMIYLVVDNLLLPTRAKMSLRKELACSMNKFKALWSLSLLIFLRRRSTSGGLEAVWSLRCKLTKSLKTQEALIALASDEPMLWHKSFEASAYLGVVRALAAAAKHLSILCRASALLDSIVMRERDLEIFVPLQAQVEKLESVTEEALEEATEAVHSMIHKDTLADVAREKTVHQFQGLLRLRAAHTGLIQFVNEFFADYIVNRKGQTSLVLTSHEYILSLNGLCFASEGVSASLVELGHALRELVERELTE